jgi:hypothetical protein
MGHPVIEPDVPPAASGAPDAANESAWERGLRHAKEVTAFQRCSHVFWCKNLHVSVMLDNF